MWISAGDFMKLMDRLNRNEEEIRRVRADLEEVKKRPVVVSQETTAPAAGTSTGEENASKLLDELINGVPDETTGKVIWTDGRK